MGSMGRPGFRAIPLKTAPPLESWESYFPRRSCGVFPSIWSFFLVFFSLTAWGWKLLVDCCWCSCQVGRRAWVAVAPRRQMAPFQVRKNTVCSLQNQGFPFACIQGYRGYKSHWPGHDWATNAIPLWTYLLETRGQNIH